MRISDWSSDVCSSDLVPQATFNLRRLCTRYFGVEPMVLGEPNVKYGIEIKGQGAGADRICNTVGAAVLFPKTPMDIVDFGTATTRSEARRVGKEWVSTFKTRWSPDH